MSDREILEAIDALEEAHRPHDPHGLIWLMKALVTGEDVTNHPNSIGDPNRRRAFKYLREDELLRNGRRTKAGAAAAPTLLAVTRLDGHPAKPYARMLLVDLLANDHLMTLTTGLDVGDRNTKRRYARGRGRDILDLLVADADRVIDELDHVEPSTRSSAAFLLGFLSPAADRSLDRLRARGEREEDPWVKASLMLAAALVASYRGQTISAAELAAWCVDDASPLPRALAWVAALYSDRSGRALEADALTDARAESLFTALSSGDPDPRLFPWACGRLERVLAWQLADRGEAAALFGAGVLARASRQGVHGSPRYALEALRLCLEERFPSQPLDIADLDAARKGVVSELSRQSYAGLAFGSFGLPASPADRRRWLGETAPTALDRLIEVDGQGEIKLGERLRQISLEILRRDRELRETRRKSRRKLPPREALDYRQPVLSELRAHATGVDLVQALCLLACGALDLAGRPIKSEDVHLALEETRPSAEWIRATLEMLAEDRGNLRGSGVGMALACALAGRLPEGMLLPDEYDDLLFLTPTHAATTVMRRLSQERRDARAVQLLERDLRRPHGVHHLQLQALMRLDDDVMTASAVAELAIQIADELVENSDFGRDEPEAAGELRARVIERYGSAAGTPND